MKRIAEFAMVLLLLVTCGLAQVRAKRLILKDGSYQMASKWEVAGERVRYYSTERSDWEELPNSLVDWAATDKYNSEPPSAAEAKVAANESAADAAEDAALQPVFAAPDLKLPDEGGIYLLDQYKQQPQLIEVMQNGSELNKQMGKNILRAVIDPLPTGSKQTFELKGAHARLQAHTTQPAIFININYDTQDENAPDAMDRFRIIRVTPMVKQDKRVIANLNISIIGKVKEKRDIVPVKTEKLSADWIKITPEEPMEPGEYAIAEMLNAKQMNMYVWDFGVNPSAPANPGVWRPVRKNTSTGTVETPVLTGRPK